MFVQTYNFIYFFLSYLAQKTWNSTQSEPIPYFLCHIQFLFLITDVFYNVCSYTQIIIQLDQYQKHTFQLTIPIILLCFFYLCQWIPEKNN